MKEVVILVHGIRDFALWQNEIRSALEDNGFIVEATNYGRFNILQFLAPVPLFRRIAIRSVSRQIRIVKQSNPGATISVIAHSFGTFVIAHIMRTNFDVSFDRVIFCGSVVPYNFRFEDIRGRFVSPILNEVGTRDIWPAVAESITFGYGSAGTYGFRRPLVRDRWHNNAYHGYFLNAEFCNKFWIPFLKEGFISRGVENPEPPRFWVRLLTTMKLRYFLIFFFVVSLSYAAMSTQRFLDVSFDRSMLPDAAAYCTDIKSVIASQADNFSNILGGRSGDNRVPTVPLEGWEDCIIFMDSKFSEYRRYSCKIPGFQSVGVATRAAETAAKDLINKCLTVGYAVSTGRNSNEVPHSRIVGRGINAVVKIGADKNIMTPLWDLRIDVN